MVLTTDAIESLKDYVNNKVAYAVYETESGAEKVPIHRKERLPTGEIAIFFAINPKGTGKTTIKNVKVYDNNGKVFAEKSENIKIEPTQEGVLYRFVFDFKEQESEV